MQLRSRCLSNSSALLNTPIIESSEQKQTSSLQVGVVSMDPPSSTQMIQALSNSRPLIGEMPKYSGSTSDMLPEDFLSKFNRYCLVNGWDEEKKMLVVPLQLKDAAESWYESLPEGSEVTLYWEPFKTALIERFTTPGSDAANFALFSTRKQRPTETAEKYFEEMKK